MGEVTICAAWGREWPAGDRPEDLAPELAEAGITRPRRLSRLIQMALIGALGCTRRGDGVLDPHTGVYLASGHSEAAGTAAMVEQLYREGQAPMPFDFINVSSNMAGFHVARALGLSGPNMMLARGPQGLLATLELLGRDAANGHHLLGCVEVCGWPRAVHRRRLAVGPDTPLAEASCWLWLGDPGDGAEAGRIHWLRRAGDPADLVAAVSGVGDCWLAFGEHLRAAPAAQPARGDCRPLEPQGPGYHEARDAKLLCDFLERGDGSTLLLLDRHPMDRDYLGLCLTNASSRR